MSMAISSTSSWLTAAMENIHSRYEHLLSAASEWNERRVRYNTTYMELSALSDRDLADIGIPRADIRRRALQELSMESDR